MNYYRNRYCNDDLIGTEKFCDVKEEKIFMLTHIFNAY